MRQALALIVVVAAALALLAVKNLLVTVPEPPAVAAPGAFDTSRAAARLARVLGDEAPHPVDSLESDAVRARLLAEMRAVGLQPRVADTVTCTPYANSANMSCARIRNLVATIGPAQGRHLLLSAHYDSTYAGPGASDAGLGVASLLEIAHLLRGQRLARPVTFLFNEGEEMGLIGARAFLDSDPVAPRVDNLINLEARGVSGPALMFETSMPNATAIAAFARGSDRPFANSLSADVYRLLPNSTDVSIFNERPWTILNFAVTGNETRYHTAGDDMAALEPSSLHHMGTQALALTRLIAADGVPQAAGNRAYMDLVGRELVVLPSWAAQAALGLLVLGFAVIGWRRGRLLRALGIVLTAILLGTGLAFAGEWAARALRAGDFWRAYPLVTHMAVYAGAAAGILMALSLASAKLERRQLRIAAWLGFLLLGAAATAVAPGAAILFLAPPAVLLIGVAFGRRYERIASWTAIVLLFLTFGALLALVEQTMVAGPFWAFAPIAAAMLLPVLVEARVLISDLPRTGVVAGAVALAALAWVPAMLAPAYSADRQQMFNIDYVQQGGRAWWAVNNDGAPLPAGYGDRRWTRQTLPLSPRLRWTAETASARLPAPAIEVLDTSPTADGRRLRIRLRPNGSEMLTLSVPVEAGLIRAGTPDRVRPLGPAPASGRQTIRCAGRACEGLELVLETRGARPIQATLIGLRRGLPAGGAALQEARPSNARPQYSPDGSWIVAGVTF